MRNLLYIACLAFVQVAYGATGCGGHGDRITMLVTTSWLAGHLHDDLDAALVSDPVRQQLAHRRREHILAQIREWEDGSRVPELGVKTDLPWKGWRRCFRS